MIAPSSLSAFAPSVQPLRVPAAQTARTDGAGAAQKPLQPPSPQVAPPGRPAPRGSLLDLSV